MRCWDKVCIYLHFVIDNIIANSKIKMLCIGNEKMIVR